MRARFKEELIENIIELSNSVQKMLSEICWITGKSNNYI